MSTLFITKSLEWGCYVEKNEDGTLALTTALGEPLPNAGTVINGCGGIDAFLDKCIETSNDLSTELVNRRIALKNKQVISRTKRLTKEVEKGAIAQAEYESLTAKYAGQPIPVTYENLKIVMAYLCSINRGMWILPELTHSYTANQYDCDGITAVTIVFDEPIELREGYCDSKFAYNAPMGHLSKYCKIRS